VAGRSLEKIELFFTFIIRYTIMPIISEEKIHKLIEDIYENTCLEYVYVDADDNNDYKVETKLDTKDEKNNTIIKYYNRANKWDDARAQDTSGEKCDGYYECEFDDVQITNSRIHYSIENLSDKFDMSYMVFPEKYKVVLRNLSGFNDDHRGSNHTKIELDFHPEYELPNNTQAAFIEGLYRIKSHKFDKWYELYSRCTVRLVGSVIVVSLTFDHGS
jgi:hypothetical protein